MTVSISFILTVVLLVFSSVLDHCYGMCPFARMMNQYNFSGEWEMTHKEENKKYLLHVCHPLGNEIFFGISHFDEPDWLVGFGGGNWSQWNMGIGGIKYMLNGVNNSISESGFIVTMDPEGHDWFLRDLSTQYGLDIHNQEYSTHDMCAVPYGYDKRVEKTIKTRNLVKKKRFIPREIEKREKKIRKLDARNAKGDKDEKISKLKEEIEELKQRPIDPIKDEDNPDNVIVPTLFGKTFITNDNNFKVTFIDNNTFCIDNKTQTESNFLLTNISSWYGGTAYRSNWNTNDGRFGTQFYVQYDRDKVIASTMILSEEKKRGYSTRLSLIENDGEALDCPVTNNENSNTNENNDCDSSNGNHCEL